MNFNGPEEELLPCVSQVLGSVLYISGCISSRDMFFCALGFVISP